MGDSFLPEYGLFCLFLDVVFGPGAVSRIDLPLGLCCPAGLSAYPKRR